MYYFKDRIDAGKKIINELTKYFEYNEEKDFSDYIVVSIPRGGVIIGDMIATNFNLDFDIVVSKKIGAENNKEFAIGAVMPDGSYFLNKEIANINFTSQGYINEQVNIQRKEIERRLIEFRGSKTYDNKFENKKIILVDDGIATGSTIIAATQWIKVEQKCQKLIVVVPVAPSRDNTIDKLKEISDKVIVLHREEKFFAVGQFYENFDQVEDIKVKKIMKNYGYPI
ncbi:MAG: phosphoribosyltransferase [Nitrososphaeraceae archaeon]